MEIRTHIRFAAVAAIVAGLLRAADPFLGVAHLADATHQQLWFVIDVLLLFGATGIYLANRATGLGGFIGYLVFVLGILEVRSTDLSFFGFGGYQAGATVALIGIALFALALLARRTQIAAAALWLTSLAAGLASRTGIGAAYLIALSGILFGLGFAAAGVTLLRKAGEASLPSAAGH